MTVDAEKIRTLLAKLDNGKNVSMRDLQAALGKEGVDEYNSMWQAEMDRREYFKEKPDAVVNYEAIVKKGDFFDMRADSAKLGTRSKIDLRGRDSRTRLRQHGEKFYEQALEYLEGEVASDPSLRSWFDRDLDFATNGILGTNIAGIPRVVTSGNEYNLCKGAAKGRSKIEIKRELLEYALENGSYKTELTEEDETKLEHLMAKLKTHGRK